ncbi:methyltransferase domain-containing protein [Streptomyces sp. XD-27]|uniref:methyltransferase domain-containing protein n=1 Tax=Streptomyces sp. XD-27 TaxID=3062779 RepID=UPI0026F417DA|nr:methyltransferase domain-containing protein [Streptomyces sp. XD-27]WKX72842.1 SAM-dependent methyltransferase [Streptomyces sp. XD-27]
MTPTLVQRHHPDSALVHPRSDPRPVLPSAPRPDPAGPRSRARAVDWAEIQERMLVPLYEAVYARLDVGAGTRLLGLGCGSGLALLMAAARGAEVYGTEADPQRLALARERLARAGGTASGTYGSRAHGDGARAASVRLLPGGPGRFAEHGPAAPPFTLVTAFDLAVTAGCGADGGRTGDAPGAAGGAVEATTSMLREAAGLTERGSAIVLAGWGPPERCATASVFRVAARLAYRPLLGSPGGTGGAGARAGGRLSMGVPPVPEGLWGRDDLELIARRAGLRPDGSGRVTCPFGYADVGSAVRGLLSTGVFDTAERATDGTQVRKEITEALHPYRRPDGTVWMPNVFRYVIART